MSSTHQSVLLVINGTDFGGTESALFQLAQRLERRGHEVHVLSIKPLGRIGVKLQQEGIGVSTLGMSETVTPLNLLSGSWKLARWLRGGNFSIIHSFLPRANIMSRVANRLSRCRKPHLSSERSTDYKRSPIVCRLNRYTAGWTDVILAVTPCVRDVLIKRDGLPAGKIQLLENGIDLERIDAIPRAEIRRELGLGADAWIVCSAGRLIRDKGYVYLIRAFAAMRHRGRDVHLLLIGEGPEEERLRLEIEEQELAGAVHLLGFRRDVPGILKDVDAFVLSSLEEGVPVVLLEAMACSVPAIATDVGGVGDIIVDGETGSLVAPAENWRDSFATVQDGAVTSSGDVVNSLARAMDRYVENRDLSKALGSAGRARLQEMFTIERVVARLEGFYSRAVRGIWD